MKGIRGERLAGEFQKEISSVISGKLRSKFPELSAIISVEKAKNSFATIKDNAGFIRHELAAVMRIRTVPELRFILDGSMEYGEKIDKILSDIGTDNE